MAHEAIKECEDDALLAQAVKLINNKTKANLFMARTLVHNSEQFYSEIRGQVHFPYAILRRNLTILADLDRW